MKLLFLSVVMCMSQCISAQETSQAINEIQTANSIIYNPSGFINLKPVNDSEKFKPIQLSPTHAFGQPRKKSFSKIRYTEDDEQIDPGNFAIYVDQDFLFFFPKKFNEDRNYTQGTSFVYSHPNLKDNFLFYPVKKIAYNKLNPKERKQPYSSSLAIGATAFTPLKIDSADPIIGDRPFSFIFFLSTSITYASTKTVVPRKDPENLKTRKTYHTWNLNYGMFGTRLGYEFQSFAHKKIVPGRPTDPKGWNHQISAGGHPTILVDYNRFQPLIAWNASKNEKPKVKRIFDLGWNIGGSLGYYDRIATGVYARLGFLNGNNQARWNGGFSALNGASYQKIKQKKDRKVIPEIFAFGRFNTTLMLRNSMLVGQRFVESTYTLDPSWAKTILWEYEWGMVVAFEWKREGERSARTAALVFRTIYRSPEFDSRIFPVRRHYFGSAGLLIPVF